MAPAEPLFAANTRHTMLLNTSVTQINNDHVVIDREHTDKGFGLVVPFDYLIIATVRLT